MGNANAKIYQEHPFEQKGRDVMDYKTADTSWLSKLRYGISFHWTAQTEPRQGDALPFQKAVERFRLEDFLGAVKESGADYVIFTSTHAKQALPCPSKTVDSILKGRTCERDLLGEIADGLERMGKSLVVYYNHSCNRRDDSAWEKASGYHDADKSHFARNLQEIVAEMGSRYGARLKAWWFDSSYSIDPRGPENTVSTDMASFQFPWEEWTKAAKSGLPERLVAYNAGVMRDFLYTKHQDYWAGEMTDLKHPPSGRLASNGLQWHGWTCLDDRRWVWKDKQNPEPKPLYSDAKIAGFLAKCRSCQAPMCFNVAISQEGIVSSAAVSTLKRSGELALRL